MEEEKKKKKNKKKKSKQPRTTEDVAISAENTAYIEQNHVATNGQDYHVQTPDNANVQAAGDSKTDAKLESQQIDGAEGARLEEEIRRLQNEKHSCIQSLGGLEEKIIHLQSEKDYWLQKEAALEGEIKQLLNEKTIWTLKEASLEDKIQHLEDDINSRILKEVAELEESKSNLLQENQRLINTVSILQSQIQGLERETFSTSTMAKHESEDTDLSVQLEVAHSMVEKLTRENAELVQKVNELYFELDQRSENNRHTSMAREDPSILMAETVTTGDNILEYSEKVYVSNGSIEPTAIIQTEENNINIDETNSDINTIHKEESPRSFEAGESEEIVQVPLDENEIEELEIHAVETDERREDVSLSEAPLIGAPFRLISFMAKYVSGADLVKKNVSNSSHG